MILVDLAHSPSAKSELVAKSCEPGFLFANSRARTMGTDQKSDRIADMAASASHPAVPTGGFIILNAFGNQGSPTIPKIPPDGGNNQKVGAVRRVRASEKGTGRK